MYIYRKIEKKRGGEEWYGYMAINNLVLVSYLARVTVGVARLKKTTAQ